MTAIVVSIRGKVEICSHENKHIKSLFLTCKFVNAHYDRIKVLRKIRESMTLFCRKCVIFRETFIVDYANVGFFPRVVYFVVRLEVSFLLQIRIIHYIPL